MYVTCVMGTFLTRVVTNVTRVCVRVYGCCKMFTCLPEVHVYKAEQSFIWRGPLRLGALCRKILHCAC